MRKGTSILIAALSVAMALAAAPQSRAGEESDEIAWGDSFAPALKQATNSGKPVMVDVWAVWCVPCHEMDKTTYRDKQVMKEAAAFVPLKIDADIKTSFIERYRVDAYPTLLFLDCAGREITRWRGAITAEPLAQLMARVRSGYAAYLEGLDKKGDPEAALELASYLTEVGNAEAAAERLHAAIKRQKKAETTILEALELRLAETQLAAGSEKAAIKTFDRLSSEAVEEEIKGKALLGLVRAERLRGRQDRAEEALERLRREYPELAASLES